MGQPGSPGVLTIVGDYTQTASGVLVIEVGGPNAGTDFDQLAVTGQATLDGTLTVNLTGGFVPSSGDSFQVLTFGSGTGVFATIDGDGPLFTPSYDPTDVTLVARGPIQEDYRQRTLFGFTTSGVYHPRSDYSEFGMLHFAALDPLHPVDLVRGGTANFLAVLTAAFPPASGWTFVTAANDLSNGSLTIHSYDVLGVRERAFACFQLYLNAFTQSSNPLR